MNEVNKGQPRPARARRPRPSNALRRAAQCRRDPA